MVQHNSFDMCPCGQQQVVLHRIESRERIAVLRHQLSQPPSGGFEHVPLPPGEEVGVVLPIEEVRILLLARNGVGNPLRHSTNRGALQHRADHLVGDEADHRDRVHAFEFIPEIREQALGNQLEEDGVVTLEGREHIRVGLQFGEPVF